MKNKKYYTLREYIETEFDDNQAAFARAQDVQPAQVTQWIKQKCIVVSGVLHGPRRKLKAN